MQINIQNKTISSKDLSNAETAWRIEDAVLVLEYFKSNARIVLGGDILTQELEHNYDSWYYNIESDEDLQYNIQHSIKTAFEYISSYIKANGKAFYVIFVTK